jgi:hypothetical protein
MLGNPFHANSIADGGLPASKMDEGSLPMLSKTWEIIQVILRILNIRGIIEGNRVNSVTAITELFATGVIDQAIIETLEGAHMEFIKMNSPDSIESVPDLCYETGLGIEPEPEPTIPDTIQSGKLEQDDLPLMNHLTASVYGLSDCLKLIGIATGLEPECLQALEDLYNRTDTLPVSQLPELWDGLVSTLPGEPHNYRIIPGNSQIFYKSDHRTIGYDVNGVRRRTYTVYGKIMVFPFEPDIRSSGYIPPGALLLGDVTSSQIEAG